MSKGIAEFVEVAKRAYKNNINAKFLLVGDVDMDNPMSIPTSTLSKWNMKNYIEWKGYSKNMLEALSSASIICLPSYREGLPKVLIEACAAGIPIVTTDAIGCRDCVEEGLNGFKVPVKSVIPLANAIEKLLLSFSKPLFICLKNR